MGFTPYLVKTPRAAGGELITLGHPLLDAYLELVTARARPNTVLATAYDLKVFFSIVDKDPAEVTTLDVLAFIRAQRAPRHGPAVVRIEDGEQGLANLPKLRITLHSDHPFRSIPITRCGGFRSPAG